VIRSVPNGNSTVSQSRNTAVFRFPAAELLSVFAGISYCIETQRRLCWRHLTVRLDLLD